MNDTGACQVAQAALATDVDGYPEYVGTAPPGISTRFEPVFEPCCP